MISSVSRDVGYQVYMTPARVETTFTRIAKKNLETDAGESAYWSIRADLQIYVAQFPVIAPLVPWKNHTRGFMEDTPSKRETDLIEGRLDRFCGSFGSCMAE